MDNPEPRDTLDAAYLEIMARVGRYLDDRASAEDVRIVEAWMAEDAERGQIVEQMRRARAVSRAVPELWRPEEGGARLVDRLNRESGAEVIETPPSSSAGSSSTDRPHASRAPVSAARVSASPAPRRRGWSPALRIAAGVVALVGGTVLWQQREMLLSPAEVPMREVSAGVGERIRVTLNDGTEIVLGSVSRVWVPEQFGREREVRLEGEAVFNVAGDPSRPFLVRTEGAVTRVLGTRFGVRAFAEDGYVEVTVAEGQVAVTASEPSEAEGTQAKRAWRPGTGKAAPVPSTRLRAGQAVRVEDGAVGAPRVVDAERLLAWTEGHLNFEDAPLAEVARALERHFGTRIELADPTLAELRLTAELRQTTAKESIRLIALSLGIEYRQIPDAFLLLPPR